MISGKRVRCEPTGAKSWGRLVAVCFVGEMDLRKPILEQGWAMTLPQYLKGNQEFDYLAAQDRARKAETGLWGGELVTPKKWRQGERLDRCE